MSRPPFSRTRAGKVLVALACLLALASSTLHAPAPAEARRQTSAAGGYRQTNLVSDLPGVALVQDPLLRDPWGLARAPARPFAVASRASNVAALYRGGANLEPVVRNPSPPAVRMPPGVWPPSGVVANNSDDFVFTAACGNPPCQSGPAHLIFASTGGPVADDGHLSAWSPALSEAVHVVAARPGHGWTGLAAGNSSAGPRLYAADFVGGHLDVFDTNFAPSSVPGGFADPTIPAGFHPFNVQNLGGQIYVTYAKLNPGTRQHVNGPAQGFVRKFDQDGVRDQSFAINGGLLDAPYGLAISPAGFEPHGSALLVGSNSHQGRIHAYDSATGAPRGTLTDEVGIPIQIQDLRGLAFGVGLTGDAATLYFVARGYGFDNHGLFGSLKPAPTPPASRVRFDLSGSAREGQDTHFDVTVRREGDASGTARVSYATYDISATQRSDYQLALGELVFAPGETVKTFRVLIVDDFQFGAGSAVTVGLVLSNPVGAALVGTNPAELLIFDNEFDTPREGNPVDGPRFFVLQHYFDFLNRVPGGGLEFWANEIEKCGDDQPCRDVRRVNVSGAFFLSIEFQRTGMLAYLTHRASFAARPLYGQFMRSTQALQRDYAFGAPGHEAQLEANKQRFFEDFVVGPEFVDRYPALLTPAQFVDALYANAGFAPSADERKAALDEFGGAPATEDKAARARALRRVAENETFSRREFREAFVLMQYFGYLRRDPDEGGFRFWLQKLDEHGGNFVRAEMVKAFILSIEYRARFGPA